MSELHSVTAYTQNKHLYKSTIGTSFSRRSVFVCCSCLWR